MVYRCLQGGVVACRGRRRVGTLLRHHQILHHTMRQQPLEDQKGTASMLPDPPPACVPTIGTIPLPSTRRPGARTLVTYQVCMKTMEPTTFPTTTGPSSSRARFLCSSTACACTWHKAIVRIDMRLTRRRREFGSAHRTLSLILAPSLILLLTFKDLRSTCSFRLRRTRGSMVVVLYPRGPGRPDANPYPNPNPNPCFNHRAPRKQWPCQPWPRPDGPTCPARALPAGRESWHQE